MKNRIGNILLLVSLFLICSFSACEREYEPTGHAPLVCKINGEFFKAENKDWKRSATNGSIRNNDTLSVSGTYSVGLAYRLVGFRIVNFSGPGFYIFNSTSENYGRYYDAGLINAYTGSNHTGELIVTHYLPGKGIVAGTLNFIALDRDTGETYKITDGKFDVQCRVYQ